MATSNVQAFRDRVLSLLSYDPVTGIFGWRVNRKGNVRAGSIAGTPKEGYVRIIVDGRRCYAHRLAWLIMTSKDPTNLIDHKDSNRSNSAFSNLREANKSENACNSTKQEKLVMGSRNR